MYIRQLTVRIFDYFNPKIIKVIFYKKIKLRFGRGNGAGDGYTK